MQVTTAPGALATVIHADTPDKIPTSPVDGKPTVVYWDICGLQQPIRLTLALAGVEWVDVRVDCGDPSTDEYKKLWMDFKPSLEPTLLFPNLPYLLDGEIAISQSNVILRYLGRKYGLMGEPASLHLVDLVLDEMADFDKQVTARCYSDKASLKPYCEKQLPSTLQKWARMLGDKSFLTGMAGPSSDLLTVADLKFYETIRKIKIIEQELLDGTGALAGVPSLLAFCDRVEAVPALKAYIASDAFLARPLNNAHAQFK